MYHEKMQGKNYHRFLKSSYVSISLVNNFPLNTLQKCGTFMTLTNHENYYNWLSVVMLASHVPIQKTKATLEPCNKLAKVMDIPN